MNSGQYLSVQPAPGLDAKSGLKLNPEACVQNQPTTLEHHAVSSTGDGADGLVGLIVVNIRIFKPQIILGRAEASR